MIIGAFALPLRRSAHIHPMETGLKDRVVVITGASQGMGRATALAFAREGARLALCARNEKSLTQAAEQAQAAGAPAVYHQPVDVTDEAAVARFIRNVADRYGRVDVCVANAGGPPAKNFLSITTEEWRKAVEQNFLSVVFLAREVIPHMQRAQWGRFITITSTSVRQPVPDLILSNAVRASVVGLVKSLANDFGKDGILVNNVGPGFTGTDRLKELAATRALAAGVPVEEIYSRWATEIPVKRIGRPEEIADVIVFLASERASFITGQTILVDGGNTRGV